jgi:hypothetical protein
MRMRMCGLLVSLPLLLLLLLLLLLQRTPLAECHGHAPVSARRMCIRVRVRDAYANANTSASCGGVLFLFHCRVAIIDDFYHASVGSQTHILERGESGTRVVAATLNLFQTSPNSGMPNMRTHTLSIHNERTSMLHTCAKLSNISKQRLEGKLKNDPPYTNN